MALSLRSRAKLWQVPIDDESIGPRIHDLEGDGTPDVVLGYALPKGVITSRNDAALEAYDGATGARRWHHRWPGPVSYGVRSILPGPDLDGDAHGELFVASYGTADERTGAEGPLVHALSGRDGHAVWAWGLPSIGSGGRRLALVEPRAGRLAPAAGARLGGR